MAQGVSRLSVKIFLSHSAEKNSRGSLLRCVSEKFRQLKSVWIRGGGSIKIFSRKFFSYSAEKISRVNLLCCVSENFRQPKSLWIRGGGSIMFFSRQFFFAQCRKSQQGNPSVLCFRKLLVAKSFMDKKGGISRVSVENFLSDSAEKFRRETLQCVISFGYRKILCFRGLCNDFLSKNFCLTVPKHFVVEPFCAVFQKNSGSKIFIDKKGGISRVSVENFLSDSAEKFRSGTLQCVINFGYRKILCFKGLCNDFLSKKFCLIVPKHFVVEPFCAVFQKISGSKKVYRQERGGSIKFFLRIFFRLTVSKNAVGFSLVFQ